MNGDVSAVVLGAVALSAGVVAGLPAVLVGPEFEFAAAGVLGGVISLAFVSKPGLVYRLVSVIAGGAAGHYLVPVIIHHAELSQIEGRVAALVLGLCAMPIFGGAHRLALRWRDDPLGLIDRLRGKGGKDG